MTDHLRRLLLATREAARQDFGLITRSACSRKCRAIAIGSPLSTSRAASSHWIVLLIIVLGAVWLGFRAKSFLKRDRQKRKETKNDLSRDYPVWLAARADQAAGAVKRLRTLLRSTAAPLNRNALVLAYLITFDVKAVCFGHRPVTLALDLKFHLVRRNWFVAQSADHPAAGPFPSCAVGPPRRQFSVAERLSSFLVEHVTSPTYGLRQPWTTAHRDGI